jgi:hypothetical protein
LHGMPRRERAGHTTWSRSDGQEMVVERWQLCRNHKNNHGWRITAKTISQSNATEGWRATDGRTGFSCCGLYLELEPSVDARRGPPRVSDGTFCALSCQALCFAFARSVILEAPTGATRFRRKLPLLEGMPGPTCPQSGGKTTTGNSQLALAA